jgi:uncharacterized protein DUF4032/lipopolysaccharide kinase (Kdo/WaaP) family protein
MVARPGHPDFLDLPWDRPLESWEPERFVRILRGISRHVVRVVQYGPSLYVLKELPERLAFREYRLLRALDDRSVPVVDVVGVVTGRVGHEDGREEPLEAALITEHLEYSLPYRRLFTGRVIHGVGDRLLDALSQLLVRLHLTGFFWGDCSLSNALFRRDAGALTGYVVDVETGELHEQLSDGQREHDLAIAEMNIVGELMDVDAAGELPPDIDPIETAGAILARYRDLWSELVDEEVFAPEEAHRIHNRLYRLNELGFDVSEIELVATPDGTRLRFPTQVVEAGHYRRRLLELTGLWAQENQARRLLNDLAQYRAALEHKEGQALSDSVAAHRWLMEVFEPTIAKVPPELVARLPAAEIFHEILEHRWFLSESEGRDVGMDEAIRSYIDTVLRFVPDERTVLPLAPEDDRGEPEPPPEQ